MTKTNVLFVEDDESLGFVVKDNLELNGFAVQLCKDGESAKKVFLEQPVGLCLLDVMLPQTDGFALAGWIRSRDEKTPIVFLTAKSLKEDRIKGFRLGADDYIVKPFSMEELVLRLEAILKRSAATAPAGQALGLAVPYNIGQYLFDRPNLKLSHPSEESRGLTQREGELLELLAKNRNKLVSKEEILIRLWGEDDYFKGRSLDVFITRLRKYLKSDPGLTLVNIHGVGYRLEERQTAS